MKKTKDKEKEHKKQEGITLVELLAALFVFSMLLISITTSTVLIMTGYRGILISQNAQDELRYVTEFMSRELRTTQCPLAGDCQMLALNSAIDIGTVFGQEAVYPALEFVNYKNQFVRYVFGMNASGYGEIGRRCVLNDGSDFECDTNPVVVNPPYRPITSKKIDIKGLTFIINGDSSFVFSSVADQRQPLITILIDADFLEKDRIKTIYFQTSVSSRRLQS